MLDLMDVEGVGAATETRLKAAGVTSVRQLATVNTRDVHVEGISRERMQELKKEAQKTLYAAASGRVVTAAKRTSLAVVAGAQSMERQTRTALREALEAAWEAEHRALEALRASQTRAQVVAEAAAERARDAQRVASEKAQFVLTQVQKAPSAAREAWDRYGESATEAQAKAVAAAKRAGDAAKSAGGRIQEGARSVGEQGKSFFLRVRSHRDGDEKTNGSG